MALVGRSGRAIRRPQMTYDNVEDFTTPEPQPFGDPIAQTPDELGVYLMWTLPAALRHGTQKQAGSGVVEFPFVPNRWLVIRILTQPGAPAAATSWIVESDALDGGTSPYLDANMTATQVGAKRDAGTWTEPGAKGAPFLRAVAPGNPAFAAFQPHNENVFSIKDDLNGIDSGTLDYFVAGWYAGDGDPLGDWALDSLNWDAPDLAHRTATRSLYHGALLNLEWSRNGGPLKSAADDIKPQLALGNTSTDALVAFLKANQLPDSDAELLEAFTLDLLGELAQPGGEEILRRRLHASWFASEVGGYVWEIVDAPAPLGTAPAALTDAQRSAEEDLLHQLNDDQAQLDGKRRQLASLQRELYELWWKRGYGKAIDRPDDISDTDLVDALHSLAGTIRQLKVDVDDLVAKLPDPNADSAQFAKDHGVQDTRLLTAGLAPRFHGPADPVLLVAGLGHDLVLDPGATLKCRYADALVTAIGDTGAADVSPPAVPKTVPAAIAPLLTEFELLRGFCASDPDGFAARLAKATISGPLPAILPAAWKQAWLPLYLEWEADWQELPYQGSPHWTFDGHDFAVAKAPPFTASSSFAGRTLLTPGLAFAVRSRLEQYIAGDPSNTDLRTLEDDVGTINDWDFLSQTLDGLTTQLAWRDPSAAPAPDAVIAPEVGQNYGSAPYFHPGGTFEGMRAGRLALTRVSIVDRFGQAVDLLGEGTKLPTVPAVAASLQPTDPTYAGVAQLPPRLLQGSRLHISAGHTAGSLCGFLVPNHIDHALAAYDASGARLGELRLVATDAGPEQLDLGPGAARHAARPAGIGHGRGPGRGHGGRTRRVQELPDHDRRDAVDDRPARRRPGRRAHGSGRAPARRRRGHAGLRAQRTSATRSQLVEHAPARRRSSLPRLRLPRAARHGRRSGGRSRRVLLRRRVRAVPRRPRPARRRSGRRSERLRHGRGAC